MCTQWAMEMIARRTKKVNDARNGNDIPIIPTTAQTCLDANVDGNSMEAAGIWTERAVSMSGPTLGQQVSGEIQKTAHSSPTQCCSAITISDQLRSRGANRRASSKTGLLRSDIILMAFGNAIPSKHGRIEVGLRRNHFDQYLERRSDVGLGQKDCYDLGVLVKIGGKLIRERNDHIGLRLLMDKRNGSVEKPLSSYGPPVKPIAPTGGCPVVI